MERQVSDVVSDVVSQVDGALVDEARLVLGSRSAREAIELALGEVIARRRRDAALAREEQRWSEGAYSAVFSGRAGDRAGPRAEVGTATGPILLHASALAHAQLPAVRGRLSALLSRGALHTCIPTEIEVLACTDSPASHREAAADRRLLHPLLPIGPDVVDQAVALQERVVEHGCPQPDLGVLLVAACGQLNGMPVLHQHPGLTLLGRVCGLAQEEVLR